MTRTLAASCVICIAAVGATPHGAAADAPAEPLSTTTIGVEGRVIVRIPGPALRAAPVDDRSDVLLRIAASGDDDGATLYDLRFVAQRAGEFDLRGWLTGAAGAPASIADPIPVRVGSLLPGDQNGDLFPIAPGAIPHPGGYRLALVACGILWLTPIAVLVARRVRRRQVAGPAADAAPPTFADLLAPLVQQAAAGELPAADRARLEMLVVAHWRERLSLAGVPHLESLRRIREDAQAGALVRALEAWLHRPTPPDDARAEAVRLLDPYRASPALTEVAP